MQRAKIAKEDEFYTRLVDIENELKHYKQFFKNKIIFCNCDDPFESNFFKYFAMNFNYLGLKKLICTSYAGSPISYTEFNDLPLFHKDKKMPYMIEITEVTDYNKDGAEDLADIEYLLRNNKNTLTLLDGNGDFRSEESIQFLEEADIVVTNPPFSLFREYIAQLIKYKKHFVIIGNKNSIAYKEIFQLIKENKIWLGYGSPSEFDTPYGTTKKVNGLCRWFTNLNIEKRYEQLILYKKFDVKKYLPYKNYEAIDVDKVSEIPLDYDGVMGVPITFLDKYCPNQFEILECHEPAISLHDLKTLPNFKEYKSRQIIVGDVLCQKKYHRIFIKRRKDED